MDAEQFRQCAETNQNLADYLEEVAQEADSDPTHRTVGVDFLFIVAAYALYLYVRNHLDHQRGLQEAELRLQMEKEVDTLVQKGYARDKALSAVLAVSKAVASRPPDDSVLKAGLALLSSA